MGAPLIITGDVCSVKGAKYNNEDYALVEPSLGACLADGMGGEQMGEAVARCACNVAMRALAGGDSAAKALERSQAFSRELVDNLDCGRSGAAVTAVRLNGDEVEIAWAGDVLCMHFSACENCLNTVTKPDRTKRGLTNALGGEATVVNTASCALSPGDRLLLCSDGVWECVDTEEVRKTLADAHSPLEAAVSLTMGRRCTDDATAVVLFAEA